MAIRTLIALSSAARASYSSGPIVVGDFNSILLDLDVNVTALTGGTSPTVTFKVSRIEPDGVNYVIYNPTALNAAGVISQTIGAGGQTLADPDGTIQIDMVTTGSPTSITFSLTLTARGF